MNPTSDTGWWIANLVFGATDPNGTGPDSRLPSIQQVMVSVRCEHWREAFWKARRVGLDRERTESIPIDVGGIEAIREVRWQFVGITSLAPMPSEMTDSTILSSVSLSGRWLSLRDLWELCVEDYSLEKQIGEPRSAPWYRALDDPDAAGF